MIRRALAEQGGLHAPQHNIRVTVTVHVSNGPTPCTGGMIGKVLARPVHESTSPFIDKQGILLAPDKVAHPSLPVAHHEIRISIQIHIHGKYLARSHGGSGKSPWSFGGLEVRLAVVQQQDAWLRPQSQHDVLITITVHVGNRHGFHHTVARENRRFLEILPDPAFLFLQEQHQLPLMMQPHGNIRLAVPVQVADRAASRNPVRIGQILLDIACSKSKPLLAFVDPQGGLFVSAGNGEVRQSIAVHVCQGNGLGSVAGGSGLDQIGSGLEGPATPYVGHIDVQHHGGIPCTDRQVRVSIHIDIGEGDEVVRGRRYVLERAAVPVLDLVGRDVSHREASPSVINQQLVLPQACNDEILVPVPVEIRRVHFEASQIPGRECLRRRAVLETACPGIDIEEIRAPCLTLF